MKQTNKSAVGTSFHGYTIKATVNELKKVLGKPVFSDNDGTDKVNFEWNMETSGGDVFSVYDWKEYRPLNADEIISWHIGGKKPSVTELAQTEIEIALKAAATPSPLPETAKTVKVINGGKFPMNDEETHVLYDGEWREIQDDQDGDFYFIVNGKTIYFKYHIPPYNKDFGDEKICKCGHPYYRHFDTYENMKPVGCKYCKCSQFVLPETETGVGIEENGFYLFSKLKPFHNQEIIYWMGGEKKGVFDAKNNIITGIGRPPKYWKPAPPTPGNERQGDIFSGVLEGILISLTNGDVTIKSGSQAHYDLETTNKNCNYMLNELKNIVEYLEWREDFMVEDSAENENAYGRAKKLINSITGGK